MRKLKIVTLLSMIVGFLFIGVSVFYYLVIYIPQKDAAQRAAQKRAQTEQAVEKEKGQKAYDNCINKAESNYLDKQREMCWEYNYDVQYLV